MGLGLNIALFVGVPAVVIVGLGLVFTRFREQILGGASAVGSTFAGIFTRPVTGFIGGISTAFGDLPDIDIRIPAVNITGGGINLPGGGSTGLFEQTTNDPDFPMEDPLPPSCECGSRIVQDSQGNTRTECIPCDRPVPPDTPSGGLTPFAESFLFQTGVDRPLMRGSLEDVLAVVPGAIGLFDFLATPQIEFIPVAENQLEFFGESIRFSGQLFEEIAA